MVQSSCRPAWAPKALRAIDNFVNVKVTLATLAISSSRLTFGPMTSDKERNRLTARVQRYGRVGANVGGVAARIASTRLLGLDPDRDREAAALAAALGGLKGPIMKVAQLLSTIPEALPAEYAAELGQLQSQAPPMGWPFVRRRMAAELGPDWESRFASFEHEAAASASLGQVHRARAHDGRSLAAKLQYPDMQSAVEADLKQLALLFTIHRQLRPAIETSEMKQEIAARLREELDYGLEASHMRLYALIFAGDPLIRVPEVPARTFHAEAAHHDLARGATSPRLHGAGRSRSATKSPAPCSAPGGTRSAITA